jgi:hypothetical protein
MCQVSQSEKVSGYKLYNISDLLCKKESDYRDVVYEFGFTVNSISPGIL